MWLNGYAQGLGYDNWKDYSGKMRTAKAEEKTSKAKIDKAAKAEKAKGKK